MADAVIGCAFAALIEVAKCLAPRIGNQMSHLRNYNNNLKSLQDEVEKLMDERATVVHRVDAAERNGEEIERTVQTWLGRVNEIVIEADEILIKSGKIITDEEKAKSHCFKGLCSNLKTRYQFSKIADEKVKHIAKLQKERKFDKVSQRTIPQEKWLPASYEFFESRKETLAKIEDALRDPNVNMVGVYGMGGIGKTALVKEIAMKAEKEKLFDEVVFAHVSETPEIRKIQGEIADKLGLKFKEETESGRARKLRERLTAVRSPTTAEKKIVSDDISTDLDHNKTHCQDASQDTLSRKNKMKTEAGRKTKLETKILVILDDIWNDLDLETIGIPLGDDNKGCQVLLTARSLDVLRNSRMNCKKNFQVSSLHEEEAWSLFKKIAGECVENCDLKPIAFKVTKECGGLPIAVVTIATALRNRELHHWKTALQYLKKPSERSLSTGVQAQAYSSIELSYKYLEDDQLRLAFLLCSLVADDIFILDLLKYSMGWGLFQGVNKLEEARNELYTLLDKLKASCLLLDGQTSESFSMHDVIRDVAYQLHPETSMFFQ